MVKTWRKWVGEPSGYPGEECFTQKEKQPCGIEMWVASFNSRKENQGFKKGGVENYMQKAGRWLNSVCCVKVFTLHPIGVRLLFIQGGARRLGSFLSAMTLWT